MKLNDGNSGGGAGQTGSATGEVTERLSPPSPPKLGWIAHVRTHTLFGWAIRKCLNNWNRAYCDATNEIYLAVWGNHDGVIVPCPESALWGIGVGEAVPFRGGVVTPWEAYLRKVEAGKYEMRWLSVIGESDATHEIAARKWVREVKGTPYDWKAIFYFLLKTSTRKFSDRIKDWKFANYCTEGVGVAWMFWVTTYQEQILIHPLQSPHPTPMTVEQCAGWVARKPRYKTTLKLVFP